MEGLLSFLPQAITNRGSLVSHITHRRIVVWLARNFRPNNFPFRYPWVPPVIPLGSYCCFCWIRKEKIDRFITEYFARINNFWWFTSVLGERLQPGEGGRETRASGGRLLGYGTRHKLKLIGGRNCTHQGISACREWAKETRTRKSTAS